MIILKISGIVKNMQEIKENNIEKNKLEKQNFKQNISLVILSIIITFLLIEISIRISVKDNDFGVFDEILGSKESHKSISGYVCEEEFCNYFTSNSDGFFDKEFKIDKNSDEKRIFLMGDSFIEAAQVHITNSTHNILENKVKEKNSNAELYNFAISGHGPSQYLIGLKHYAPKYKPDLVIFSIYLGNDLRNINPDIEIPATTACKPFFELKNNSLSLIPMPEDCKPSYSKVFIKDILRKSRAIVFFKRKLYTYLESEKQITSEIIPNNFFVYKKNNKDYNKSFELFEKILLDGNNYAKNIRSQFMIVTFPDKYSLEEKFWNTMIEKYPAMKNETWDFEYPIKRIDKICEMHKINCLHLRNIFKEYVNKTGKSIHFKKDSHWNEEGNRLAAEEIFKYIEENNLLNDK